MKHLLQILIIFVLAANMSIARQGDEITPADSLFVDGVRKIPASIAREINKYKNTYGYPIAGWDTSRRELWIKVLAGTGTLISRVETPGSIPKLLLSIQAGGVYDVYFQPQGKYLFYNKDADGNEVFQFFLYDIATRESKPITDAKLRSTEPIWSNAGDRIIYSSSPPGGNGVDLSLINPFEPQSNRLLAQGQGII